MKKLTKEQREEELERLRMRFIDVIDCAAIGITNEEIVAVFNGIIHEMSCH